MKTQVYPYEKELNKEIDVADLKGIKNKVAKNESRISAHTEHHLHPNNRILKAHIFPRINSTAIL